MSSDPSSFAEDTSAVAALYERLLATWNARDAASYAGLFAPDGNILTGAAERRRLILERRTSILRVHPMSQTREPLDRETPPPAPLWVKVAGGIAVALLLLVVILHLSGNSFSTMHGGVTPPMNHSGQQP